MRTIGPVICCLLFIFGTFRPVYAIDQDQVDGAIKKGTRWLRQQQQKDGSWRGRAIDTYGYPAGPTAVALWALMKAGVSPKDPGTIRGFAWLHEQPLQRTYSVSLAIMATEARWAPRKKEVEKAKVPYETYARKVLRKRMSKQDRAFIQRAAEWLIQQQSSEGIWNYPWPFRQPDLSNAQFAVLALKSAERVGVRVPESVFESHLKYLLEQQESSGPAYPRFSVPSADGPIGLKKVKKKKQRKKKKKKEPEETRPRDAIPDKLTMTTRGWAYKPGESPRASMTGAGTAMAIVCKAELEDSRKWKKTWKKKANQAIRDGMAWLAYYFVPGQNTFASMGNDWVYYNLFTLERACTLASVQRLGPHDWYDKGAEFILSKQSSEGNWNPKGPGEKCGAMVDTCFAILFLTRATPPVLQRPVTHAGGGGQATSWPKIEKGSSSNSVTFRFVGNASNVSVAGDWESGATQPMIKTGKKIGDSTWELTVEIASGSYVYRFVLDGKTWIHDPLNPKSKIGEKGGVHSVLVIP